ASILYRTLHQSAIALVEQLLKVVILFAYMEPPKVLIVEDDPLISRMYEKIFSFENYKVVIANDGEDGLVKVKSTKPTIVLLDVMMPKMNGLEVLEKIKADPETKAIPVVMLTNLAGDADAETALSKGAVKYIIKSQYDPKQITDMVKEILAGYTRDQIPGST
ncbi:MAG TPA: response regulator, partial [Candidatus Saccharimonadales bacterium]|nr:response regulator [Candidatus Saccharimonadales bacterium]